ncbi:MAG: hypothetical protein LUD47_05325, partial [Clostridia bacterium]|nr:hypothetical protein [Clostridia bacterium]
MRKSLTKTKIACVATCAVLCAGIVVTAASCGVRNKIKLDADDGNAINDSNGGFVVETNDYIYYINGIEYDRDENRYGNVEKGALMRISRDDFSARNYSNVETVVPQNIFTYDYNAGIYIYDGYVYYCTPSTDRNSDGEIL